MTRRCAEFIKKLSLRSHSALFYADQSEKFSRLLNFIYYALVRGYVVRYLAPQDEVDNSRELMRAFGIKVTQYEKRDQLRVLSSNEFYLERCEADKEKIIPAQIEWTKEAVVNGFNGLFVAGDMSCFLDEGLESELIDYELLLGRELSLDGAGLCIYEASRVSSMSKQFKTDLIRAHGSLIFHFNVIKLIPPDPSKERLALNLLVRGYVAT